MSYKKTLLAAALLLTASMNTSAQFSRCVSTITDVSVGPQFRAIIRLADRNCGANGWVCAATTETSGISQVQSNQVVAAALTAQATDREVSMSWNTNSRACGNFPNVVDFRVLSPAQ